MLLTAAVTILKSKNLGFLSRKETASGGYLFAQNVLIEMNTKSKLSREINHKGRLGEVPGQLDNIYIPNSILMIYSEHMVRSWLSNNSRADSHLYAWRENWRTKGLKTDDLKTCFRISQKYIITSIHQDFQNLSIEKSFSPSLTSQRYLIWWDETKDEFPIHLDEFSCKFYCNKNICQSWRQNTGVLCHYKRDKTRTYIMVLDFYLFLIYFLTFLTDRMETTAS